MEKNDAEVCREFCLVSVTFQTIWKDGTKIINAF